MSTQSADNDALKIPLSGGEVAQVVKRLHDMGLSVEAISEKTGMRAGKVNHLLAMSGLPPQIYEMFKRGEVAGQVALELVIFLGPDKANELLTELIAEHGDARISENAERLLTELAERRGLVIKLAHQKQFRRAEGFYRVLCDGQWTVAKFLPIQDYWTVFGDDRDFDEADFDRIDESRIEMPDV